MRIRPYPRVNLLRVAWAAAANLGGFLLLRADLLMRMISGSRMEESGIDSLTAMALLPALLGKFPSAAPTPGCSKGTQVRKRGISSDEGMRNSRPANMTGRGGLSKGLP